MNALIVYGTTEGQTRKIAEWTKTHVRKLGHEVELRDSASPAYDSDLVPIDAFIIGASVHQARHQDAIINFAIAHHELLNAKPAVSVSPSAVLEDEKKEAQKYVDLTARPVQAALTSAATFAAGAAMPLLMVVVSPLKYLVPLVAIASLVFLAVLGAIGARTGGADVVRTTARVTFWGALAMAAALSQ